ncbi:hypothetical protein [Brevundimonas sp.]|uniref:hypothetical protein n=1 Tax=Brevundimonas sp. TaxID=1871086 RepID=UPI002730A871|nr:hypothetical protein [Brevundimonas sp.]MDP1914353.1 hypothetical protein [Brevundimonas sp.]
MTDAAEVARLTKAGLKAGLAEGGAQTLAAALAKELAKERETVKAELAAIRNEIEKLELRMTIKVGVISLAVAGALFALLKATS